MAISDSNLRTSIWTEIRNKLVNNVYITNSTTATTSVAGVGATYNDEKTKLPYVVINPINPSMSDFKFGSKYGKRGIPVIVDCYASNTLGADQMVDIVEDILLNNDIEGIEVVGTQSNSSFEPISQYNKVFGSSITITYDRE